jgi:putative PIN family toxin of toxin-antitoxin system
MGKAKKRLTVVLDANILVSALLFHGELSRIVNLWKGGSILPVFTKETFAEFREVLHYPKFSLKEDELRTILEDEVLPFFEAVETENQIKRICRDSQDDKFIACAVAAQADYIVSGDKDLLVLNKYGQIKIISASEFLKKF